MVPHSFVVARPRPQDTSDAAYYDWAHLYQSYRTFVTPAATVLEIGASNLERTKQLAGHCKELIGVELMPERTPADFSNVRFVLGDWQQLSACVSSSSIDVAISSHVMEHVKDDVRALRELYTVLKPGGVALLNTPNRKRLTRTVIELFTGEKVFPYEEHEREYVEQDIVELVRKTPFQRFEIIPVTFGLHGGPLYVYAKQPPRPLRHLANFWEVHLFKEDSRLSSPLQGG